MTFLLSSDLTEFQVSLRAQLLRRHDPKAVRDALGAQRNTWADDPLWKELAALGSFLAPLPEADGGLGLGVAAASVVCEEVGAALTALPIFEQLVFGIFPLIAAASSEQRTALLAQLSAGEVSVAGVVPEAEQNSSELVVGYSSAAYIAVLGESLKLFRAAEVESRPVELLDILRRAVAIETFPAPAFDFPLSATCKLRSIAQVLAVSEMLGAARTLLNMTVDYAKTRKQFGAPIGSFQAVQHKLADVAAAIESTAALTRFAAWSIDSDSPQAEATAQSLKVHASTVLPKAAEDTLQVHGGIGFTYEYDLHLYLRRIVTLANWFGSGPELAEKLGLETVSRQIS